MIKVRIRAASLADEAEVIALWAVSDLIVPLNDPGADFRFALNKQGSEVLLALDEGERIVGSVMVGHDGHRGWIYYVAALPDTRNQGVGRACVEAAEDWLGERGMSKVQLMIRETNSVVRTFYERMGYDHTPRIVMAKWLTRRG